MPPIIRTAAGSITDDVTAIIHVNVMTIGALKAIFLGPDTSAVPDELLDPL
jgi:hypothetical protein